MPQAVGVYLASAYTTAAVGTAGAATAASAAAIATTASAVYAAGYAVTYAAIAYGMSAATKAMAPDQKPPALDTLGNNYIGTREPRRIIYGEQKVGGLHVIPPIATSPGGDWVHIVLALAGHECNALNSVFFDETEITNAMIEPITGTFNDGNVGATQFKNVANIRRYVGTATQTVDYILNQADPTAFTSDFRGRGIAYVALRLQHKGALGGPYKKGVPQITVMVQGRKCYDPRTGLTAYTTNPALCARDYLVTYCGFDASQIDDSLVTTAANICDQDVLIPPAAPATYQKRYTCNLVLEADEDWLENLRTIVDCMRGRFVYRDGKWRIYAGAWETPSLSVTQADWIGAVRVRASAPMEERWNAARVWYTDKNRNYARSECFARRNTTYETADGDLIWRELEVPGCATEYEAQRHGEFMLRQSRNQLKITGRLKPQFGALSTWDTVQVTDDEYGWNAKTFRVASMDIAPSGEVDIALIEEGSATWTDLAVADYNNITTVPTLDPGATLPSERLAFAVTAYAGSIEFSWDTDVNSPPTRMIGEQTRLLEYVNSGAYGHLATELWRGTGNRINIPKADATTRFYYVQGVVGSETGPYTPNTYGYGMGALSAGAGPPGADGVMVGLTLPAVTLPASSDGTVGDYAAAAGFLQVMKAGVDVTSYAATRASSQAGVTGTVNSAHGLPWASNSKGAYRVTACTSDIGVLWTEAVYSGTTYVRPFVVSKARAAAVNTAPLLRLAPTGQSFAFSGSDTVLGVSTIGFTAVLQNVGGTAGFYANNYRADNTMIASYALAGAGNADRGLHVNSFHQAGSTAYCVVVASLSPALTDRVTVVRLRDGTPGAVGMDALVAYLTNETIVLPASSNGYVPTPYTGANGAFVMMLGLNSVHPNSVTYAVNSDPQALTEVFSTNGTFAVTGGFDAGESTAMLYLRGTYSGSTLEKIFTMGKALGGVAANTAATLQLVSNAQAFTYSGSATSIGVNTIDFGVLLQNVGGTAGFTVTNFLQDGTPISSYDLAGAGNTGRALRIESFTAAGSTAYATVTASIAPGLYDQITVVRLQEGASGVNGAPGADALTAYLTNEVHTLPASSNGAVGAADYGGAAGTFVVMLGVNSVSPNSITYSINQNPQALTSVISPAGTFVVSGGLDPGEALATLTLRAVYSNSTLDKVFTLGKSKAGAVGSAALGLTLQATGQQFRFSGSGTNIGVNTIGVTAVLQGLSGTAGFYANNFLVNGTLISSYALGGSGNANRALHVDSFLQSGSTAYTTIVASIAPGFWDTLTVVRVQEGASGNDGLPGLVGYLTNENHTLPASSNGVVGPNDYGGAAGTFVLMLGLNSVHPNSIAYSIQANPQALTSVISPAGTYVVSGGLDAGELNATLTLRAVYSGSTLDKVFTLGKSQSGDRGGYGPPGANLIPNGFFDQVDASSRYVAWVGSYFVDTTSGPNGSGSLRINSAGAEGIQEVVVAINPLAEEYEFKCFLRVTSGTPRATVSIQAYNDVGMEIGHHHAKLRTHMIVASAHNAGATQICVYKPNSNATWASLGYTSPQSLGRLICGPYDKANNRHQQNWAIGDYPESLTREVPTVYVVTSAYTVPTSWDQLQLASPTSYNFIAGDYIAYASAGSAYLPLIDEVISNSLWAAYEVRLAGETNYQHRFDSGVNMGMRCGTRRIRIRVTKTGDGGVCIAGVSLVAGTILDRNRFVMDPETRVSGAWTLEQTLGNDGVQFLSWVGSGGPTGNGYIQIASHGTMNYTYFATRKIT